MPSLTLPKTKKGLRTLREIDTYLSAMRTFSGREPSQIAVTITQARTLLVLDRRQASDTEVRQRMQGTFYSGIPMVVSP